jgi:hypothetical protein
MDTTTPFTARVGSLLRPMHVYKYAQALSPLLTILSPLYPHPLSILPILPLVYLYPSITCKLDMSSPQDHFPRALAGKPQEGNSARKSALGKSNARSHDSSGPNPPEFRSRAGSQYTSPPGTAPTHSRGSTALTGSKRPSESSQNDEHAKLPRRQSHEPAAQPSRSQAGPSGRGSPNRGSGRTAFEQPKRFRGSMSELDLKPKPLTREQPFTKDDGESSYLPQDEKDNYWAD